MKTVLITKIRKWRFYDKKVKKHYERYLIILPKEDGEKFENKKVMIIIKPVEEIEDE